MTYVGWDRKLWGIVTNLQQGKKHLLGTAWDTNNRNGYSGEPTRPLLFMTRKSASKWCKDQQAFYRKYSNACRDWRFYPVRVRETITPVAKTAVEK